MNNDISNLLQMFAEKNGGDTSKIDSLLNMMQASNNSSQNSTDTSEKNDGAESCGNFEMPDIETIMKLKKITDSMRSSSKDPSINLLASLKPYLRDEKKSKIDEYIKVLNISKAISMYSDLGGDNK